MVSYRKNHRTGGTFRVANQSELEQLEAQERLRQAYATLEQYREQLGDEAFHLLLRQSIRARLTPQEMTRMIEEEILSKETPESEQYRLRAEERSEL